ncbi:MAG TPA: transposase [Candidatus Babeliales bacterium]|jgi:putative transposase|nr:transposase [Candidatus Babeliales bacterium]
MSQYRRFYQSGGNYFFTLVTYHRRFLFANPENVKQFKIAINKVKKKYPFSLNAIVILPDHLHCLWKLPENDKDFSTRWRLIKRYFSMEMKTSVNHRNEKEVWQRRFWEHIIRNENDWQKHMDYIHYNPVKHGLVKSPRDWTDSSFNYWVEKGIYEKDWGSIGPITIAGMQEAE